MSAATSPNHHRHHRGFSGPSGVVAAVGMSFGREGDARIAAELTGLRAGQEVVDIGCGPGVALRHAARLGANAVGVEPAAVMRRFAQLLVRSPRVTVLEGHAEQLPVETAHADVVWSIAAVHHWADVGRGLAEVGRVLKPGGCFLAVERCVDAEATGHGSHGWTDQQAEALADACRNAGFASAEVSRHPTRRGTSFAVLAR